MSKDAKKPAIRFHGFTDAWERRRLGEVMNVTSVKRIHQSDWTDTGIRFLRARDIVSASKNEEPDDYLYISKEKYDEYSLISGKVTIGDLLVTGVGTIGVPYLIRNSEPLYFKDGNIIWFQNGTKIDGAFFLYSFFGKAIQDFINESAGIGTVGTYTIESGKKTPISLPEMREQQQIGAFFEHLDNLIALHQRKHEQLENIKKSMLEKMFPREGHNVPEIRFAGFTSTWKRRRLGDVIVKGGSGGTPLATRVEYYGGSIPFLAISDIAERDIKHTEKTITEAGLNNSAAWIVPSGAVSLAMYASVGKVGILTMDSATSQAFYNMVFDDNIIRDFVYYRLVRADLTHEWEPLISTGTQRNLNAEKVKSFSFYLSTREEMKQIASFLWDLDNLIALHQRKCEKLKQIKQSLLEKMFV